LPLFGGFFYCVAKKYKKAILRGIFFIRKNWASEPIQKVFIQKTKQNNKTSRESAPLRMQLGNLVD
jgi:hypothetical protein